jgi:hypothetical protein
MSCLYVCWNLLHVLSTVLLLNTPNFKTLFVCLKSLRYGFLYPQFQKDGIYSLYVLRCDCHFGTDRCRCIGI